MISRRTFLGTSTVGVAAGAAGCVLQGPSSSEEASSDESLPASLAGLKSMTGEAKPIGNDERKGRIEKARRLMGENDIAAIVLAGGTSLDYFTGIRWGNSERFFGLIVPAKGNAFVVCPAFERDRAMEQIAKSPLESAEVLTWQEDESPYALAARGLKDRGARTGRLGIEETVRFVFSDGLRQAASGIEIASATPVTAGCRMVKDAHELDLMRLANKITLAAYEAAYLALEEGMTQGDFRDLVSTAHRRLGASGGASVQVGEYSALPHGSRTPQKIVEGSILLIDGGCSVQGYESDMSRTFVLGKPSEEMVRVFDVEFQAQTAALKAARPGVECQAVDAAARKVIEEAGYGKDYEAFTHRVGHGIGMDGHEWPYLVRGNTMPLQPGMTFSDEPGIYQRGKFGVRLEDIMVITADGAELMTPQSPSLEDPFGRA